MGRMLIILGLILVAASIAFVIGERIRLGRLPGDIIIEREGVRIYIPITTMLIISIVVSLALWLAGRW